WIVFLGIRPWDGLHHHLGRETFLAPVAWAEGGWPVVNEQKPIALRMQSLELPPAHPFPPPFWRDDFSSADLALPWNFIRNPSAKDWSLSPRPGFLRLVGSAVSLDDIGSPAFVGRRQQHHRCRASTLLEFDPERAGEEAGICARSNEENHYQIALTRGDKGK